MSDTDDSPVLAGELDEAIEQIVARFAPSGPVAAAAVYRIDNDGAVIEAVARTTGMPRFPPRIHASRAQMQQLITWCAQRTVVSISSRSAWGWLLGDGPSKAWVGPLTTTASMGLAMVIRHPSQAGRELVSDPLGLFAALLEKACLLRDISRLRESSQAEQRALSVPQDISISIIGSETGLRSVMDRVELVAHTDTPVLILGETGSGKEVVARTIHERSRRAAGPILRVNCGAIPSELVDSELFGHERGSFTGAVSCRKGWFERADGGTLFLDEVAELSLGAQVRLLRVLQDGHLERVGAQRSIRVDVRVVAATHRDLRTMVQQGRFRDDLWYRISVFPILLPPLRERREDIPSLATHFARRAGMRLGAAPLLPTPDDAALLLSYEWPGNVRELAAVIERAAILGNGKRLELRAALGVSDRVSPPPSPSIAPEQDRFLTLDQAMSVHIQSALARTKGIVEGPEGAATLLGINPHTLRARMRKLGIDWARYRRGRPQ